MIRTRCTSNRRSGHEDSVSLFACIHPVLLSPLTTVPDLRPHLHELIAPSSAHEILPEQPHGRRDGPRCREESQSMRLTWMAAFAARTAMVEQIWRRTTLQESWWQTCGRDYPPPASLAPFPSARAMNVSARSEDIHVPADALAWRACCPTRWMQ